MKKLAVILISLAVLIGHAGAQDVVRRAGVQDLKYKVGQFSRPSRLAVGESVSLDGFTPINVLAFGVDNTGAVSCADSLQAVIDSVSAWGGGDIYFPPGTYLNAAGASTTDRSVVFTGDVPRNLSGGGPRLLRGSRSPVNYVHAPIGSIYQRWGDADSTLFFKKSANDSTGWYCVESNVALNSADIDELELSAMYNVMAYGAEGNGVADDSGAIQAAINAAVANGGGTVLFPYGTYAIASAISCTGADSVTLCGDGTVVASATNTEAMFAITTSDYFTVKDLRFDGNELAKWGFDFKGCSHLTIDGVEVFDMKEPAGSGNYSAGIRIGNNSGTGGEHIVIKDSYIHDITSDVNNTSRGIVFYTYSSTGDAYIKNITISGCVFREISPVGNGDGLVFQQAESDGSQLIAPINATVTNCVFDDCYKRGIKVQNRGVTITGNTFRTSRTGAWDGLSWYGFMYAGISVYQGDCSVSGNTFTGSSGGAYQYGIEVDGGTTDCENVSVSGNTVSNSTVATGESADPWQEAYGIRVSLSSTGSTSGVSVVGNTVNNTKYGYWAGYDVDDVVISNNISRGAYNHDLVVYTPTDTITNLVVTDNVFPKAVTIGARLARPFVELNGVNTPEGRISAPRGSLFHRADNDSMLYVKGTDNDATGWVLK